jgi:hypothetical protein
MLMMPQLSYAVTLRPVLCFREDPPKPAGTEETRGNRVGKANLFQKNEFSDRDPR